MRFPTAAFQLGSNVGLLRGVSKQWDITLSHKGLFALWSCEVLFAECGSCLKIHWTRTPFLGTWPPNVIALTKRQPKMLVSPK